MSGEGNKIRGAQIRPGTLSLDRLEINFLRGGKWNPNQGSPTPGTITGIPDPTEDLDVSNRRFVLDQIAQATGGGTPVSGGIAGDGSAAVNVTKLPNGSFELAWLPINEACLIVQVNGLIQALAIHYTLADGVVTFAQPEMIHDDDMIGFTWLTSENTLQP